MIKLVQGQSEQFLEGLKHKSFAFPLILAGTELIKHEGISAAGANQEMLSYTAALDAEYLEYGHVKTVDNLPVSPAGIVSPAIITKACLDLLLDQQVKLKGICRKNYFAVDAGAFIKPDMDYKDLGAKPSKSIETGSAIDIESVEKLFAQGRILAREYLEVFDSLLIAECVVAGTTTALGLLRALGFDSVNQVSSSLPNGNHDLKHKLVEQGFANLANREQVESNPLHAVAAMGDAMQALAAGMALEALFQGLPVVLAGGSQMLAVAALIEKIIDLSLESKSIYADLIFGKFPESRLTVATTPWVIKDQSADIASLAKLVCPRTNLIYPEIDFNQSKHDVFKAYQAGHVKEGVGAGAAICCALNNDIVADSIINRIDELYEQLLASAT